MLDLIGTAVAMAISKGLVEDDDEELSEYSNEYEV
jgi:hypothetical protein